MSRLFHLKEKEIDPANIEPCSFLKIKCYEFIIRADFPRFARKIAAEYDGPDWLDPKKTTCRELGWIGKPGIVISKYK